MSEPVTITLTKESFNPRAPKLWDIVEFCGRTGIVYAINKGYDEDGENITIRIHGWKPAKYPWVDAVKLLWLKIKVKLNWI